MTAQLVTTPEQDHDLAQRLLGTQDQMPYTVADEFMAHAADLLKRQIDVFKKELADVLIAELKFRDWSFVLDWVRERLKPGDVFDADELEAWARANGFIKKDEAVPDDVDHTYLVDASSAELHVRPAVHLIDVIQPPNNTTIIPASDLPDYLKEGET